jgi:hypothetical protein
MNRLAMTVGFALIACGTEPPSGGGDDVGGGEECMPGERAACQCAADSVGTTMCDSDGFWAACGECGPIDLDPTKVNFQAEIVPIINRSCGTSGVMGCHARDAYGASVNNDCRGWLTLENESLGAKFYSGPSAGQPTGCPDRPLHYRLTQIDVWQCLSTSVAYVTPGDVSKSYIMNKLNGVNMCKESASSPSDPMPQADSMFTISAADKALIQRWIVEGALNN